MSSTVMVRPVARRRVTLEGMRTYNRQRNIECIEKKIKKLFRLLKSDVAKRDSRLEMKWKIHILVLEEELARQWGFPQWRRELEIP